MIFFVLLLVYVDDIDIIGTYASLVDDAIKSINAQFTLKDLDSLNYFLALEVVSTVDYLLLNQEKYVKDLINKVGTSELSIFPTSMDTCLELFHNVYMYRSTLGAYQHVCITRTDINFAVNKLSQYMQVSYVIH